MYYDNLSLHRKRSLTRSRPNYYTRTLNPPLDPCAHRQSASKITIVSVITNVRAVPRICSSHSDCQPSPRWKWCRCHWDRPRYYLAILNRECVGSVDPLKPKCRLRVRQWNNGCRINGWKGRCFRKQLRIAVTNRETQREDHNHSMNQFLHTILSFAETVKPGNNTPQPTPPVNYKSVDGAAGWPGLDQREAPVFV